MNPRAFFSMRRNRIVSWAKWAGFSGLLSAAWIGYSASADFPSRTQSASGTNSPNRPALVQLGFFASDDAGVKQPVDPQPQQLPPQQLREFAPTFPQPGQTIPFPPNPSGAPVVEQPLVPFPQQSSNPTFSQPNLPTYSPPQPAFPSPNYVPHQNQSQRQVVDDDLGDAQGIRNPWWSIFVTSPMRPNTESLPLSVEELMVRTLRCSSQVRVFSDLPLIRETSITEADAAFDWTAFLDSKWQDLNDPVGNTLTVGNNSSRYVNEQATVQGGLRKKTRQGGTFQLSQQFGWQDTNSIFFKPSPQGTARMAIGYTHPLLRGSGQIYNESLIVLAQLDTDIATDEFSRQLQSHLLETLRAYWGLYLERANLAQKLQSLKRAADTLAKLKQRQHIDTVKSQVLRAKAEVGSRRSQVLRAEMGVKNAEDRLRALVNDPAFGDYHCVELLPVDVPTCDEIPLDMRMALCTAAQTRPEVNQALRQIQAGCTRLNMSKNEVLPMLNLVTEAYSAGLQQTNPFNAYDNQFNQGRPGYTVGMQFEVPLGNRAPKARLERRELELRQLRNQYQTTLNTLQLEVKVSVREVETAQAEMQSQAQAMNASTVELDYLEKRWEHLPGEDGTASLMLDNLLQSQNRLALNEFNFLTAQVTYNLALWNVKKATGELLQTEQVSWGKACVDDLPTIIVDKQGRATETMSGGHSQPTYVPLEPQPERVLPPSPRDSDESTDGPALRTIGGERVPARTSWRDKLFRK